MPSWVAFCIHSHLGILQCFEWRPFLNLSELYLWNCKNRHSIPNICMRSRYTICVAARCSRFYLVLFLWTDCSEKRPVFPWFDQWQQRMYRHWTFSFSWDKMGIFDKQLEKPAEMLHSILFIPAIWSLQYLSKFNWFLWHFDLAGTMMNKDSRFPRKTMHSNFSTRRHSCIGYVLYCNVFVMYCNWWMSVDATDATVGVFADTVYRKMIEKWVRKSIILCQWNSRFWQEEAKFFI